jgi:MFS family permease
MSNRNSTGNIASVCQADAIPYTQLPTEKLFSKHSPTETAEVTEKAIQNAQINLIKPSPFHPWIMWGMTTFFLFFQFLLQTTSAIIAKALMEELHLTSIGAGILSSTFFYAYILWLIPAGLMLDRYGSRTSFLFASAVLSIGCFVFALSHTLTIAFVGRFLMGIGGSFGFILTLYVIDAWFPSRYFSILVGITETLVMSSTAVSAVLLAWVVTDAGWRVTILVCGAIGFMLFPMGLIFMQKHEKEISKISMKATLQHFIKIMIQLRILLKNKYIWLLGIYAFCVFALQNVFGSLWGIPFIMEVYGYRLNMATLTVMMVPTGIAIGGPLLSLISTKTNQNKIVMVWGALAGFFLITLVLYSPQLPYWLLLFLIVLCGVCSGTYIQAFTIAKVASAPETRATVISLITLLTMASAAILQPFVGFLLHSQVFGLFHSKATIFRWSLAVLPICSFVAFIIALLIEEPTHEKQF